MFTSRGVQQVNKNFKHLLKGENNYEENVHLNNGMSI
jgi:hypothetical protein